MTYREALLRARQLHEQHPSVETRIARGADGEPTVIARGMPGAPPRAWVRVVSDPVGRLVVAASTGRAVSLRREAELRG